ncbi:hypothetical protein P9112_013872 [Eukaryota sp. TZLM1-RC]
MSHNPSYRPSIRSGSASAQRRIPEEESSPSSSPLAAESAFLPTSSVEASPFSQDSSSPEGSAPTEDSSFPVDFAPMERSIPPQETVSVVGDSPPKDFALFGRNNSVVGRKLRFYLLHSFNEVLKYHLHLLPKAERRFNILILLRKELEFNLPPLKRVLKFHLHLLIHLISYPECEAPSSQQPTVRRTRQNSAVPASGSSLTLTTISQVNNPTDSPPNAYDLVLSIPHLPSYFSEEQRKRRGTSSTEQAPLNSSSHASSSVLHHGAFRQHNLMLDIGILRLFQRPRDHSSYGDQQWTSDLKSKTYNIPWKLIVSLLWKPLTILIMDHVDDELVTVSSDSPTFTTSSDAVSALITPISRTF